MLLSPIQAVSAATDANTGASHKATSKNCVEKVAISRRPAETSKPHGKKIVNQPFYAPGLLFRVVSACEYFAERIARSADRDVVIVHTKCSFVFVEPIRAAIADKSVIGKRILMKKTVQKADQLTNAMGLGCLEQTQASR